MYKSLANAVMIEAAKANTQHEAAKAGLIEALGDATLVNVAFMQRVADTQAALNEWTKLYLVATKYQADALKQGLALVHRADELRDRLVEEYDVQSTNLWVNAEARSIRKARIEVHAVLRAIIEDAE